MFAIFSSDSVEATKLVVPEDVDFEAHWIGLGKATVRWPEWVEIEGEVTLRVDDIDDTAWDKDLELETGERPNEIPPDSPEEGEPDRQERGASGQEPGKPTLGQPTYVSTTFSNVPVFDSVTAELKSTNGAFNVLSGDEFKALRRPQIMSADWSWQIVPKEDITACITEELKNYAELVWRGNDTAVSR